MKKASGLFFIAAIFLTASAVWAKPVLFCRLDKSTMKRLEPFEWEGIDIDNASAKDLTYRRVVESDLVFGSDSNSSSENSSSTTFSTGLDNIKLIVRIDETKAADEIRWRSHIYALDGRTSTFLAGSAGDSLSFRTPKHDLIQIFCDAYEKTESLNETRKLTKVQAERLKYLGGSGVTREYVQPESSSNENRVSSYDVYDLFQQLARVPGKKGDQLRAMLNDISRHDGATLFEGAWDDGQTAGEFSLDRRGVLCQAGSDTFLCNRERFSIIDAFWLPGDDLDHTYVSVEGFIDREPVSRKIRGYEITAVSSKRDSPGGMSNSSGGRINGGK